MRPQRRCGNSGRGTVDESLNVSGPEPHGVAYFHALDAARAGQLVNGDPMNPKQIGNVGRSQQLLDL
jgi:hypothetical protein